LKLKKKGKKDLDGEGNNADSAHTGRASFGVSLNQVVQYKEGTTASAISIIQPSYCSSTQHYIARVSTALDGKYEIQSPLLCSVVL
jgi:hypothetical protein